MPYRLCLAGGGVLCSVTRNTVSPRKTVSFTGSPTSPDRTLWMAFSSSVRTSRPLMSVISSPGLRPALAAARFAGVSRTNTRPSSWRPSCAPMVPRSAAQAMASVMAIRRAPIGFFSKLVTVVAGCWLLVVEPSRLRPVVGVYVDVFVSEVAHEKACIARAVAE